jgi:hypothetical protein
MYSRQRTRLLGSLILLLVAGILGLAACNSNSVSGSQPKPSTSTNAEAKASSAPKGSPSKPIAAAIAQIR